MKERKNTQSIGSLLKMWRERRRKSQLDLAFDAEISTRHLSFMETGRAQPSREMILHLAEMLEIPLRERNKLLITAGYASVFTENDLDSPTLEAARQAIEIILKGHEPYPAIAVDRYWNMVSVNKTVPLMLAGVAPELLEAPVNVLRLSLHPKGLAPRIVNLEEWRNHLLARLRKQVDITADDKLEELFDELKGYKLPHEINNKKAKSITEAKEEIIVPLRLETDYGTLSFISTTTVFGTPVDITLSELALETFFPADEQTMRIFMNIDK